MANVPTDALDVKALLAKISIEVETLVRTHLKDQFKNISMHIANVYDLPPDEVLDKLCAMTTLENIPSTSSGLPLKKRTKTNEVLAPSTALLCSMNTKAGSGI